MKGTKLDLSSSWVVGKQLGSGGFGRVYELTGNNQSAVAKFVPKAPGADRELLFVGLEGVRNVVPIIESGEYQDNWVLVMPRADRSLRDHVTDQGNVLGFEEALTILLDVATALVDLDGNVVHRDLKPENVLLLNGAWCLADFGISRYVEASTAPDTHKWSMSPPYAAPERWRAERATSAADIYALGVMGFEMLKGYLPFPGPTTEDFRDQHLHSNAQALDGVPSALATVLEECLFKSPAARPSPENLLERLARQQAAPPSGGLAALQAANQSEVRRQVEADLEASVATSAAQLREDRVAAAKATYERIANMMRDAIVSVAPAVELKQDRNMGTARQLGWSMKLGNAALAFSSCTTRDAAWGRWQAPAFTVDAWGGMSLRFPRTPYEYEGRAHSLWFGDIQKEGHFAWYETSFMLTGFSGRASTVDPFDLDPGEPSAKAVWNGMAEYQVAWPFTRLDPENLDEFIERWAGWFAQAAQGQLGHPSQMPERPPQDTWRRK
ncbi:MAG: serine/threonine protein kinase [Actinomycetota bacterium]|nr:serine/threonine protein kinase [Actinomycetota bacterium]